MLPGPVCISLVFRSFTQEWYAIAHHVGVLNLGLELENNVLMNVKGKLH